MIIGLSGKMQTGKTHVSDKLSAKHGFVPLSFAYALKADIVEMGFDETAVRVTKPAYVRALLQAYGAARRAEHQDHWLNIVKRAVAMCKPGTTFIIDDVRYENEAEWVEQNGVLIRLERPGYPHDDSHESETELDDRAFKYTVYGECGKVDDLVEHVEDCLWAEGIVE